MITNNEELDQKQKEEQEKKLASMAGVTTNKINIGKLLTDMPPLDVVDAFNTGQGAPSKGGVKLAGDLNKAFDPSQGTPPYLQQQYEKDLASYNLQKGIQDYKIKGLQLKGITNPETGEQVFIPLLNDPQTLKDLSTNRSLIQDKPPTWKEETENAVTTFANRVQSTFVDAVDGVAKLTDLTYQGLLDQSGYGGEDAGMPLSDVLGGVIDGARDFIEWNAPIDPTIKGFRTDMVNAFASAMGYAVGGGLGSMFKVPTLISTLTLSLGQSASQYNEALQMTGDEEIARKAFIMSLPFSLSEALPMERFFMQMKKVGLGGRKFGTLIDKTFNNPTTKLWMTRGKEFVEQGTVEFGQETFQSWGSNLTARELYDFSRGLTDNIFYEGGLGFITGGFMGVIGNEAMSRLIADSNEGIDPNKPDDPNNPAPPAPPLTSEEREDLKGVLKTQERYLDQINPNNVEQIAERNGALRRPLEDSIILTPVENMQVPEDQQPSQKDLFPEGMGQAEGTQQQLNEAVDELEPRALANQFGVKIIGEADGGQFHGNGEISVPTNKEVSKYKAGDWTQKNSPDFESTKEYPQDYQITAHEIAHNLYSKNPELGRKAGEKLKQLGVPEENLFESLVDLGGLYILEPNAITNPEIKSIMDEWLGNQTAQKSPTIGGMLKETLQMTGKDIQKSVSGANSITNVPLVPIQATIDFVKNATKVIKSAGYTYRGIQTSKKKGDFILIDDENGSTHLMPMPVEGDFNSKYVTDFMNNIKLRGVAMDIQEEVSKNVGQTVGVNQIADQLTTRFPQLETLDPQQAIREVSDIISKQGAQVVKPLTEEEEKSLVDVIHFSGLNSQSIELNPKRFGQNLMTQNDVRISKVPRVFMYTDANLIEQQLRHDNLYEGEVLNDKRLYDMRKDELGLLRSAQTYTTMDDNGKMVEHPIEGGQPDLDKAFKTLKKRGYDYALYDREGSLPMLISFKPVTLARSPLLKVNITGATTDEEASKKFRDATKRFTEAWKEGEDTEQMQKDAQTIQTTTAHELKKRVESNRASSPIVKNTGTGVGIFYDSAEPTIRANIQTPSELIPEVVQKVIETSQDLKQEAVHMYYEGNKPANIDYGTVMPDGSAWQPMVKVKIPNNLSYDQQRDLYDLFQEAGFAGVSINSEFGEATIYNTGETTNEFFTATRKLPAILKGSKDFAEAEAYVGDIKLWNIGNKSWNATHTYQEFSDQFLSEQSKSEEQLVKEFREDRRAGVFTSEDDYGNPVDIKKVKPTLQNRMTGAWDNAVADAERRLKRYWGTRLMGANPLFVPAVAIQFALDVSLVIANKIAKSGISFDKAFKNMRLEIPDTALDTLNKKYGLIKFKVERILGDKEKQVVKYKEGSNKTIIEAFTPEGTRRKTVEQLTDQDIEMILNRIKFHFAPETMEQRKEMFENYILMDRGILAVVGDAHDTEGIGWTKRMARWGKRGHNKTFSIWAFTDGKSTGFMNEAFNKGYDTMVFVQQKDIYAGMLKNPVFIRDVFTDFAKPEVLGIEFKSLLRDKYNKHIAELEEMLESGNFDKPYIHQSFGNMTKEDRKLDKNIQRFKNVTEETLAKMKSPEYREMIKTGVITDQMMKDLMGDQAFNFRSTSQILNEIAKSAPKLLGKDSLIDKSYFKQENIAVKFAKKGVLDFAGKITGVAKIRGRATSDQEQLDRHPFYEAEVIGDSYVELAVPIDTQTLLNETPNLGKYGEKGNAFWLEGNTRQASLGVEGNPSIQALVDLANGKPETLRDWMEEKGESYLAGKFFSDKPYWESKTHIKEVKAVADAMAKDKSFMDKMVDALAGSDKELQSILSSGGALYGMAKLAYKAFDYVAGKSDKFTRLMVKLLGKGARKFAGEFLKFFNLDKPLTTTPISPAVDTVEPAVDTKKKAQAPRMLIGKKKGEKGYNEALLHPKVRENLGMIVDEVNEQLQKQKRNRITNQQSINYAIKYASKLTDNDLLDIPQGTLDRAEKVLGARIYSENKLAQALEEFKQIKEKGIDPNSAVDMAKRLGDAMKMWVNTRAIISESGRTVQIASIPVDQELVSAMNELLSVLDKTMPEAKMLTDEIDKLNTEKDMGRIGFLFYNWILSNFQTDMANVIGNTSHLMYEATTKALFDPKSFPSMMKGLKIGFEQSKEEVKAILNGEMQEESKFDETRRAYRFIPKTRGGKLLNLVLPTTRLQIEDAIFKNMSREMEKWRIASRIGRDTGQITERIVQQINDLIEAPPDKLTKQQEQYQEIIKYIDDYAKYITFQRELGKYGKGAQALFSHWLAKPVVPFVRTPLNVLKTGFDNSPMGFINFFKNRNNQDISQYEKENILRRAMVGSTLMGGISALSMAGLALVTGRGGDDPEERQIDKRLGIKPYHLYLKNPVTGEMTGFSYQNLNPVNIPLSLLGGWFDDGRYNRKYGEDADKNFAQKMTIALFTTFNGIQDQSFLSGMKRFNQEQQFLSGDYFTDMASNMSLPNIVGMPQDFVELWTGKRPIYEADGIIDTWRKKIGLGLEKEIDLPIVGKLDALREKPDVLGGTEESGYERFPFPWSTIKNEKQAPVENWIRDNQVDITIPSRGKIGDRTMTDDEYSFYKKEVGKNLFNNLEASIKYNKENNIKLNKEEKQALAKESYDYATKDARIALEQYILEKTPFDPEGSGYDYKTAKQYGITPDETGHWPSRVPETGQILKGKNHPTFYKTEEAEKEAGYEIYKGEDGKYYSRKKN